MVRPAMLRREGRVPYESAWALQHDLVEARAADACLDTLLLMQHDPVFTVGRRGQPEHWGGDESLRAELGCPIYRVERGGSVTYHGPGQVVGYPILRLAQFCAGPKAYMWALEEVLIRTVAAWGVTAGRRAKLTGVWVEQPFCAKIAAMGVKLDRGITMHGFALNVDLDLTPFRRIVPCGLADCRVTSLAELLETPIDVAAVEQQVAREFAAVFDVYWTAKGGAVDVGIGTRSDRQGRIG